MTWCKVQMSNLILNQDPVWTSRTGGGLMNPVQTGAARLSNVQRLVGEFTELVFISN